MKVRCGNGETYKAIGCPFSREKGEVPSVSEKLGYR